MNFPLHDDVYCVNHVNSLIPTTKHITKDEILLFNDEDIIALQKYYFYIMSQDITKNNYKVLQKIIDGCSTILDKINCETIVIAPGDSPAKLIYFINMVYKIDDNLYRYVDSTDGTIITKRIKFVSFPISKIREHKPENLDIYFHKILVDNNVNFNANKFIFLDHIDKGKSYEAIKSSLGRFFEVEDIDIPTINTNDIFNTITDESYRNLISNSEEIYARFYPKFKVGNILGDINLFVCNTIISMLYLLYLNKINLNLKLPDTSEEQLDFLRNHQNDIIKISYYDFDDGRFYYDKICLFKLFYNVYLGDVEINIQDKPISFMKDDIYTTLSTRVIISMDLYSKCEFNGNIYDYENKYLQVTFITGEIFTGWYSLFFSSGMYNVELEANIIRNIKIIDIKTLGFDIIEESELKIILNKHMNELINITYLSFDQSLVTKTFYLEWFNCSYINIMDADKSPESYAQLSFKLINSITPVIT